MADIGALLIIRLQTKKPTQKESDIPQIESNRNEHRTYGKQYTNHQLDAANPEW